MNMKAIRVENPGAEYRLVLEETPQPAPGRGEVLIRVAAAGVNHADLAQAQGRYPPPPGASDILGMEVSGEIAALGEDVQAFREGDRVCALVAGGGYAEFCAAPVECVLSIPKGMDVIQAAALPEVFFTVWTNLFDTARLKPGERVLIHGGSSGIGTAAIQLCAARGHEVFTTAGTATKCEACETLGARRAINYREEDFVEVVKQATEGRGVDVTLDMVGGDYIQRNISAAAVWGRIVNIAYQSGMTAAVNFGPVLMKRLSLLATTLRSRTNAEKGAIRDAVLREVWPLIEAGKIKPVVDRLFPLAVAQSAHQRMASSEHVGKIILAMSSP
jgi:putative PIG3 family NAD(P)H quinone oxidoreductase